MARTLCAQKEVGREKAEHEYLAQQEINGIRIGKSSKRDLTHFMGTINKCLFGTLEQVDKEEPEQKINY